MLIDGNELPPDQEVHCDLCIVGGGMAGIALARELRGRGHRIVVLESGGESYDGRTQALYAAKARLEEAKRQLEAALGELESAFAALSVKMEEAAQELT